MRWIFRPLLGGEFDPHRRQEGERQHRQGDVPVPAVPAAHLVAVQPDLLLGRLEALLDRPAPIRPPGWWRPGRTRRSRPSRPAWRACGAPAASGRLLQAEQPEPRPVVQTLALRPGAQAAPALQRFGRSLAGTWIAPWPATSAHSGALTASTGGRSILRCARRGLVANSMSSGTAAQRSRSIPWADTAPGRSGHGPGRWRRPG